MLICMKMEQPHEKTCAMCESEIPEGRLVCPKCGHSKFQVGQKNGHTQHLQRKAKLRQCIKISLVAVALLAFNPVRLLVWPESGNYYGTWCCLQLFFDISLLAFPLSGALILALVFPSAKRPWSKAIKTLFVWYLAVMAPLNWEAKRKIDSFKAVYEPNIMEVAEKVLSAQEVKWYDGAKFDKPYLMLRCENSREEMPQGHRKMQPDENWYRTIFGDDFARRLSRYRTEIDYLPQFKCSSAYLVVYGLKYIKQIQLDVGNVPGYRQYAVIYAVNLKDMTRMRLPDRLLGSMPKKPTRWQVHPGTTFFSRIAGEKPSEYRIQKYIDKMIDR